MDSAGNVRDGVAVTLTLAGTVTAATHYSALTGGSSATGGLQTASDGTIVDGSGVRRYVDEGSFTLTISGRSRQIEAASGTGKVNSTNVKDAAYGAQGDGTTDDSTAIQAAITAAAGNEVYFPPGTYVINAALTSCRKIRGAGAGTTILKTKASTAATILTFSGVTDGYLRDVTLDGNRTNGATGAGVFASSSTRFLIQDCHIKSMSDKGISLTNVPVSCRIEGCRVTDCAGSPAINTLAGCVVERCTVDANTGADHISVGADSKVLGCTVSVTSGASSIHGIAVSGSNVVVQGNSVDLGTSSGPGVVGIRSNFAANFVNVIGNRVNAFKGTGIALGLEGTSSVVPTSAHGCVVSDNIIQAAAGDGIIVGWDGVAGGSTGYNTVIANNAVSNVAAGDGISQFDTGIECHLPYSVIVGNTVDTTDGHGIYSSGYGTQILGNTVRKSSQRFGPGTGAGSTSGIKAANDHHLIAGNRITDPGTSTNVAWGIEVEAGIYFATVGGFNITSAEVSQNMMLETRAGASRGMDYGLKTGIRATSGATFTGARQIQNRVINPITGEFNATAGVMTAALSVPSVTSATTVTLPESTSDVYTITGTTTITSVTATGQAGRTIKLIFAGILTFTDGSNLKLAGNFVTTADDTITLVCDGTNWFETGRSVN
jgi:hypothetical protein